jgi:hypothetical protein
VSALPARERPSPGWHAEAEWARIEAAAPRVAAVMRRYLRQLGTFLAPAASMRPTARCASWPAG